MKQILRKIEVTAVLFAILLILSVIEMTVFSGTVKSKSGLYRIDKYDSILQNELK